jgi:hypothetical protein
MPKDNFSVTVRLNEELLRLTFCATIIATFFASLAADHNLKNLLTPTGLNAAAVVLGLSAAFSFAYFLSVAAALKYQGKRHVDRFPLNVKVSQFFYDASINIFGVYFLVLLVEAVNAHFLHLPNEIWVWPVYVVMFSIIYIVARVAWALAQNAIEYYYALTADSPDEDESKSAVKR